MSTTAVTVFNIADAGIKRGQRAWTKIKATAEEQRTLWLEVGVALLYGKQKENRRPGQKFSEWVQEMFPGLTGKATADALWFASNSVVTSEIPSDITHPQNIRAWFNEQQATQSLPEDLQTVSPVSVPVLPQRDAEKVAKTIQRAESGDEGAETAKRHVEALAKRHGVSVTQLTEAAKVGAPDSFYRFSPAVQLQLDAFRTELRESISVMESDGISRDAIRAIFINLANSL